VKRGHEGIHAARERHERAADDAERDARDHAAPGEGADVAPHEHDERDRYAERRLHAREREADSQAALHVGVRRSYSSIP
jgi:hypothetical protein